MTGLLATASCAPLSLDDKVQDLAAIQRTTFFHTGFGAGPVLFTDDTGHLLEERRYEPFGAPIDARIKTPTGYTTGAPDLVERDLNPLNKRTDVATGWSDHGARWLAPETGRWLTPDPPVAAPDAKFMLAPWALHPYQYVDQNPIAYWDPDGREPQVDSSAHVIASATVDLVLFTQTTTVDLTNGNRYVSYGVTTPCADVIFTGGLVVPNPGNTADDVITGFSAGITAAMPLAGAAGSYSVNPSGYIVTGGAGFGIDGISASMTYTMKDDPFFEKLLREQTKMYEQANPTPTQPVADLRDGEPAVSPRETGVAFEDRVYGPMPPPSSAPAQAPSHRAPPQARVAEPQPCWTTGAPQ
jgi:RHS repeat-associated protein